MLGPGPEGEKLIAILDHLVEEIRALAPPKYAGGIAPSWESARQLEHEKALVETAAIRHKLSLDTAFTSLLVHDLNERAKKRKFKQLEARVQFEAELIREAFVRGHGLLTDTWRVKVLEELCLQNGTKTKMPADDSDTYDSGFFSTQRISGILAGLFGSDQSKQTEHEQFAEFVDAHMHKAFEKYAAAKKHHESGGEPKIKDALEAWEKIRPLKDGESESSRSNEGWERRLRRKLDLCSKNIVDCPVIKVEHYKAVHLGIGFSLPGGTQPPRLSLLHEFHKDLGSDL
jgi:hypothetical protein